MREGAVSVEKQSERVRDLWNAVHRQAWEELAGFFLPDAEIYWHNTNERFTVSEFVRANREYPGDWSVTIQRLEATETAVVSVVRVRLSEGGAAFHATSFFQFRDGIISRLDEYWGDDGPPPQWRQEKKLGTPIL